jgi:hypothetical protein
MMPIRVFIGWDDREPAACAVLADSILRRARHPVAIVALRRAALAHLYTRPRGPTESTDFSLTRFLVPHLSGYEGLSLFLDCDILCQADLGELLLYPLAYPGKAVYVAQHDYVPKALTKFLDQEQTIYPRKNWSSVMLFDNARCRALTPDYLNHASGLELHRFAWLRDEQIGALPLEWNWLVGEYPPNATAKLLHYTNGGCWFPPTQDCDHADLWRAARDQILATADVCAPARSV